MKIEIYWTGGDDSLYNAEDTLHIVKMKMAEGYRQYEGTHGNKWFGYTIKADKVKQPKTLTIQPTQFNATRREPADPSKE